MIDKKFLLELFERQLNLTKLTTTYYNNKDLAAIEFSKVDGNDVDDDVSTLYNVFNSKCKMFIFNKEERFYIAFNSIKVEISLSEYKRLKKIIDKKRKKQTEQLENEMHAKDKKMLDTIFSIVVKSQERKPLVEKTSKKANKIITQN
jgi:hypothetical protein